MAEHRQLLILAHAFPPSGGAGVRRIVKTLRYLDPRWSVAVLTPRRGKRFAHPYDPDLSSAVPARVRRFETATPESVLMRLSGGGAPEPETPGGEDGGHVAKGKRPFHRLARWAYRAFGGLVAVPDSGSLWAPFAVMRGFRLARRLRPDALFVTLPPFSAALAGALLARVTGVPLVLEFRDAWLADPAVRRRGVRRWVEGRMERWVVRVAARIVTVTEGVAQDFRQRYGLAQDRVRVIPNGYDPADRVAAESESPWSDGRFRFVYTGTLGGTRSPLPFLQALGSLLEQRPELRSRFAVVFVGQAGVFGDGSTLPEVVSRLDLGDVVECTGFVSRERSLQYQAHADVLLLIIGQVPAGDAGRYGVSAKLFDYALTGRPVLAVSGPGPNADLVRQAGLGAVVDPEDRAGIEAGIANALEGGLRCNPDAAQLEGYDYRSLVKNLEVVLESAGNARR